MQERNKSLYFDKELGPIIRIINKYDPLNLVDIGTPDDEYCHEAEMILEIVKKEKCISPKQVFLIFEEMFYEDCIRYQYAIGIADDLKEKYKLKEYKREDGLKIKGMDENIIEVIKYVQEEEVISVSSLQRSLFMGFNKASRCIENLVDLGLIQKDKQNTYKVNKEKIHNLLDGEASTLPIRIEELYAKRKWLKEQLEK